MPGPLGDELMSTTAEQANELRDQLRVIRTHKWQIALITFLVTGTALFGAFRRTPIYEARSEVLVRPIVNPNSSGLALPQPTDLVGYQQYPLPLDQDRRAPSPIHSDMPTLAPPSLRAPPPDGQESGRDLGRRRAVVELGGEVRRPVAHQHRGDPVGP